MINRQEIIDVLKTRIEEVQEIENVFEWLTVGLDTDELPAVIVKDIKNTTTERFIQSSMQSLEVDLIVIVSNGVDTSKDLRRISTDVLQAIKTLDLDIYVESAEISFENTETLQGGCLVNLTINYESDEFTI